MKSNRMTYLLTVLRLLSPANFRYSVSYLRRYGVRLCFKRAVLLLSMVLGLHRSSPRPLSFQPPVHKTGRRGMAAVGRESVLPPSPSLSASQKEALGSELAAIKAGLAKEVLGQGRSSHPSEEVPAPSRFYGTADPDLFHRTLFQTTGKVAQCSDTESACHAVRALQPEMAATFGALGAHNFFSHLELMLGLRRVRVGIYDHAFHFAGGAQRYVAFMAEHLQDKYDVTYISNKDAALQQYRGWYNIDLSRCRLKIVKIPFFEQFEWPFIDQGMVNYERKNPFDIISAESLSYDVFVNANMLGKVQPLSPASVFFCHFPDQEKERFFAVDQYDYLVSNSRYTTGWIRKKWGLEPTHLIYPPVEMDDPESDPDQKGPIILSVSRFEPGGNKKQMEMARAFMDLAAEHPAIREGWRLVLAGANPVESPYYKRIARLVEKAGCTIELKANLSYDGIRGLYKSASIFWHACGLDEIDPRLVEHFGMTTVEAMQNYCVPIVIRGGGQVEIVEDGISGFTFGTIGELKSHTVTMINNQALRKDIAKKARLRGHEFNGEMFKKRIASLFFEIEKSLLGGPM